jgi:hypothetical protein
MTADPIRMLTYAEQYELGATRDNGKDTPQYLDRGTAPCCTDLQGDPRHRGLQGHLEGRGSGL